MTLDQALALLKYSQLCLIRFMQEHEAAAQKKHGMFAACQCTNCTDTRKVLEEMRGKS